MEIKMKSDERGPCHTLPTPKFDLDLIVSVEISKERPPHPSGWAHCCGTGEGPALVVETRNVDRGAVQTFCDLQI